MLSRGKLQGQSAIYQWMNVFGAIGLVINSFYYGAVPSGALNIIWIGIGVAALWSIRVARRNPPPNVKD